jgi:tetratricopeptide (TPR) repeat protein
LRLREALHFLEQKAAIEEEMGDAGAAFDTRWAMVSRIVPYVCSLDEGLAHCDRLDACARSGPSKVRAHLLRVERWRMARRLDEAEALARQALARAQQLGEPALQRSCELALFGTLSMKPGVDEALALGRRCLRWVGEHGNAEEVMNFHNDHGLLCGRVGRLEMAGEHYEKAHALAVERGQELAAALVLVNLSLLRVTEGRLQCALKLRREVLAQAARFDSLLLPRDQAQMLLAQVLVQTGAYAEALEKLEAAEQGVRAGAPALAAGLIGWRGLCWLRLGQFARARQAIHEVQAAPELPRPTAVRSWLLMHEWRQTSGVAEDGVSALEHAAGLLDGTEMTAIAASVQLARAFLMPDRQGLQSLQALGARAAARGMQGHALEAQVAAARLALRSDPAQALVHAKAALELARSAEFVHSYRGEFWLHLGRVLLANGLAVRAQRLLAAGADWVRRTAQFHVPEPFRESFLHRNPVNVELLALAAKLTRDAAGAEEPGETRVTSRLG